MDHLYYIQILKENFCTSAEKLGIEEDYQFYQDNDPKHSAHNTKLWLMYNCPKVIKTPARSPDFNPIDHMWSILGKGLRGHHISNKRQMEKILRQEWVEIDQEVTENFVKSMPLHLREVIRRRGRATRHKFTLFKLFEFIFMFCRILFFVCLTAFE
ncbi:transposable element Tcb1 transposase [Trichonephila clavipes]|nr:transposable element Tcb1 transposase [Trichonephila clavipes]